MLVGFILCALLQAQGAEDDARARERLADIARRCADDDFQTRVQAQRELLTLPARLIPEIEARAKETSDVELRVRLQSALLPCSWARLLPGTIGQARGWIDAIEDLRHPKRGDTIREILPLLERRPAAEVADSLHELLDSGSEGARRFALDAFTRVPPRDAALLVPLLKEPALARPAADLIMTLGDRSVVPTLIPIFLNGGKDASEAGRILFALGADLDPIPLAEAMRARPALAPAGCRLLARSGPAAEGILLELLESKVFEGREVVQTLAEVGGPRSLVPLRKYFEAEKDDSGFRDRVLSRLHDGEWARRKLTELRKTSATLDEADLKTIAAAGGPALRDDVLDWLAQKELKISVKQKLLPLLGAVGRREDGLLLATLLRERRLSEAAAEGLELIGDPAQSQALMRAFKQSGGRPALGRGLADGPLDGLEEDLLEMLSDLGGYEDGASIILTLTARRLTPPLREALWNAVIEPGAAGGRVRAQALRILADAPSAGDSARIEKLRSHKDPGVRIAGFFLALRAGDPGAARPLADLLAQNWSLEFRFQNPRGRLPDPTLDWAAPAGPAWKDAVEAAWRERPTWNAGALWLSLHGVPEAGAAWKQNVQMVPGVDPLPTQPLSAALGDPEALDKFIGTGGSFSPSRTDVQVFCQAITPEVRGRLVELARRRSDPQRAFLSGLAAHLTLPEGAPLYRAVITAEHARNGDPLATACIDALGRLAWQPAVPDLRILLRSLYPSARAAAAEALGRIGDRASVSFLIALTDDPEEAHDGHSRYRNPEFADQAPRRIWHSAMEALERITGVKGVGASVADRRQFWRDWHAHNRDTWK